MQWVSLFITHVALYEWIRPAVELICHAGEFISPLNLFDLQHILFTLWGVYIGPTFLTSYHLP